MMILLVIKIVLIVLSLGFVLFFIKKLFWVIVLIAGILCIGFLLSLLGKGGKKLFGRRKRGHESTSNNNNNTTVIIRERDTSKETGRDLAKEVMKNIHIGRVGKK